MAYLKVMKNAYEHRSDVARYDEARSLSKETKMQLMAELQKIIPNPVTRIVDLGCGTGRFTEALGKAFSCPIIGIEPSQAMLEVAARNHSDNPRITLKPGSATAIPLEDASTTLVFISQVYHHLPNPTEAFAEIRRVLGPHGFLAVRNTTRETNVSTSLAWTQFFPEAAALDNARMPTQKGLEETVTKAGFRLVRARVLEQLFAGSPQEYAEKIGQRGLSVLVALSDEAFETGMEKLRTWATKQPDEPIYEPIDLFVFQKS
jgi:ubiquinone/menaquinone biosynthesis C-methylase UbiE